MAVIRGVNRQIIEVSETGHPYFERAFLLVRSDCAETGEGDGLSYEAKRFLADTGTYGGIRLSRRKQRIRWLIGHLTAALCGAGIATVCHILFA